MKNNKQIYDELSKRFTIEEIADFAILPADSSEEDRQKAREEFVTLRMARGAEMSKQDQLLSGLLSMKYQIGSYVESSLLDHTKSFNLMLAAYLNLVNRKQKEFAQDIDIDPSRLNRILKGKERIGKKIAYRLEKHSGNIIPAIYWWKLMQKEIEEEIRTEVELREIEKKRVKYIAYSA